MHVEVFNRKPMPARELNREYNDRSKHKYQLTDIQFKGIIKYHPLWTAIKDYRHEAMGGGHYVNFYIPVVS